MGSRSKTVFRVALGKPVPVGILLTLFIRNLSERFSDAETT